MQTGRPRRGEGTKEVSHSKQYIDSFEVLSLDPAERARTMKKDTEEYRSRLNPVCACGRKTGNEAISTCPSCESRRLEDMGREMAGWLIEEVDEDEGKVRMCLKESVETEREGILNDPDPYRTGYERGLADWLRGKEER